MLKAILFDLDNTLLGNDMNEFMPRYFPLLLRHVQALVPDMPFDFLREMMIATQKVIHNTRPHLTNRDLFWEALTEQTGLDWAALDADAYFDRFYLGEFQKLQPVTTPRPEAVALVEWALAEGLQVVVATNPLFPQTAIESRLKWAGLAAADYPFALVTHYGNCHAAKPHQTYYTEILAKIGRHPSETLMVGDDWENDVVPTAALGLHTYWLTPQLETPPQPQVATAVGASLADLHGRLQAGWLR